MRGRIGTFIIFFAAILAPADAFGMSTKGKPASGHCTVVGVEKLPSALGRGSSICLELQRAVESVAPTARFSAEVKVISPSRLAAKLIVNDRALPEQKFAIMDRELDAGAIERFAHSLAAEIAKAAKS
jgi:hypothetical protein